MAKSGIETSNSGRVKTHVRMTACPSWPKTGRGTYHCRFPISETRKIRISRILVNIAMVVSQVELGNGGKGPKLKSLWQPSTSFEVYHFIDAFKLKHVSQICH